MAPPKNAKESKINTVGNTGKNGALNGRGKSGSESRNLIKAANPAA